MHRTTEGQTVPMVHLSKNLKNHEMDKPHVLLIGGLHGDDPVTVEMLLRLIRHILQGMMFSFTKFSIYGIKITAC